MPLAVRGARATRAHDHASVSTKFSTSKLLMMALIWYWFTGAAGHDRSIKYLQHTTWHDTGLQWPSMHHVGLATHSHTHAHARTHAPLPLGHALALRVGEDALCEEHPAAAGADPR